MHHRRLLTVLRHVIKSEANGNRQVATLAKNFADSLATELTLWRAHEAKRHKFDKGPNAWCGCGHPHTYDACKKLGCGAH